MPAPFFIESVQGLTHCVLPHESIEVMREAGSAAVWCLKWVMIHVRPCSPCPPPILLKPALQCRLALSGRGALTIHSEMSVISLSAAGPSFISHSSLSRRCLIFILAWEREQGTPGKRHKPPIGGNVSTLSPYGVWNFTELLSNLRNMFGIWSPCFSGEK